MGGLLGGARRGCGDGARCSPGGVEPAAVLHGLGPGAPQNAADSPTSGRIELLDGPVVPDRASAGRAGIVGAPSPKWCENVGWRKRAGAGAVAGSKWRRA